MEFVEMVYGRLSYILTVTRLRSHVWVNYSKKKKLEWGMY